MAEYRAGIIGVGSRTVHGDLWAKTLTEMPNITIECLSDEEPDSLERAVKQFGVDRASADPRIVLDGRRSRLRDRKYR